jgi:hypothetical protein
MARGVCYVQGRKLGFLYVTDDRPPRLTDAVVYAELDAMIGYDQWQSTVMRHCAAGESGSLMSAAEEMVQRWGGRVCLESFEIDPICAGSLVSQAIETERTSIPA